MALLKKKVPRKGVFLVVGILVISGLIAAGFMANQASAWPTGPKSTTTTAPATTPTTTPPATGVKLQVLSPRAPLVPPENRPLSPRLDTLDGKTVGLYDNQKAGYAAFQDVIEELIEENYPTTTVKRYSGHFEISDAVVEQILADGCDAVIFGSGD